MNEILNILQGHFNDIFAVIGAIVSAATIIVKITPTTKDDDILDKIVNILAKFSIINTKKDQEKIDNADK